MNKYFKIIFLAAIVSLSIFIYLTKFRYVNKDTINSYFKYVRQIQLGSKSYEMINSYFLPRADADILFVTFYYKNKLRGCWGTPNTSTFLKNNIREDLSKATALAIDDKRFEKNEKIIDFSQLNTLITFIKKDKAIDNVEANFSKEYRRGYHSIKIENDQKSAYYLSYIPLLEHWSNKDILKNICIKAGMKSSCYKEKNSRIIFYKTINYWSDKNSKIFEFSRYNIFQEKSLDRVEILNLIKNSINWLNINKTKKGFTYSFKIDSKPIVLETDYNYIRQLLTVRAFEKSCVLIEKDCLVKNADYFEKINKFYLEKSVIKTDQIELSQNGSNDPAYNALYILYLSDSNIKEKKELIAKLTNNMITKIKPDGSVNGVDESDQTLLNIYTGEVYFSLIKAYRQTNDLRYLKVFENGIPRLQKIGQKQSNIYLHWISQALYEYYLITKNKTVAKDIININIFLIDKYQVKDVSDKLNLGGFPITYPGFQTGFILESLADAYEVARLEKDIINQVKIKDSIIRGVRFLSQLWINENNSFYISDKNSVLGAVMDSVNSNYIRVDYLGHALVGFQKVLSTDIY
jgi:AMMECR1 domain-containing protein